MGHLIDVVANCPVASGVGRWDVNGWWYFVCHQGWGRSDFAYCAASAKGRKDGLLYSPSC
jgi:hypothetical protein